MTSMKIRVFVPADLVTGQSKVCMQTLAQIRAFSRNISRSGVPTDKKNTRKSFGSVLVMISPKGPITRLYKIFPQITSRKDKCLCLMQPTSTTCHLTEPLKILPIRFPFRIKSRVSLCILRHFETGL